MYTNVKVGQPAPEFKANAYVNGQFKEVSSKDFSGKWICLFFYPLDFTFVCPTEIRGFAEKEAQFKELNCQVIGASTDSVFSHKAWFEKDLKEVKFPVLADTNHRISRDYGVLLENDGIALRGTFLIDPNGILQAASVNANNIGRSVDEVIRSLQALETGELCPVDWKPGKPTIKK
ncbi:MAG: peroxiredoxin [Xanthomonadaceae bacterium]|nr:peroxiredoxin [Xanthomonadaceae bacterium]